MLYKTQGIAINYIKFRETSIIARIFTEQFGMQSYIVNGVRSKKGNKIALYQPLTLLDLVVYHKQNANLFRISEIKCNDPLIHIPTDVKKSCIAMFIAEIMGKTLKEEPEPALFEFIHQSILYLENIEGNFKNFHLQFLLKLSKYYGFAPETETEMLKQVKQVPLDNINSDEPGLLGSLISSSYKDNISITNKTRRELLEMIIKYYSLHIENLGEIKSVQVLKEVLE